MVSRISEACFLLIAFFSAMWAAIWDFVSAFAIECLVCVKFVGYCLKSFDLIRIKTVRPAAASRKSHFYWVF
jgi:hypothetical protein